jgi:2-dehydropantoate 2-reductase
MVVMLPANHLEPGVVQAQSRATTGVLDVGLYPGGTDERCAELAAGLERSRLSCRPDPAVMRLKYAKLLDNLSNALAVCSAPREAGDLARAARQEAIRCYRAAGIEWTSEEDFSARRGTLIQPGPIAGQGRSGGSSWQSLARGTGNIEADYLNGEIFLLGRLHGVPTPVNRALQLAANQLAREGKPPGTLAVAELRARVEALSRA